MGRPSKFNEHTRRAILEALEVGATFQLAAYAAGICRDTLHRWLHKCKGKEYKTFSDDVKKSLAKCALKDLRTIDLAAKEGNWKASAWRLERRIKEYQKDTGEDTLEPPQPEEAITTDPKEVLLTQAHQLKQAISKAEKSQSWQAYAALQRQLLQTTLQLRGLQEGDADYNGQTDQEILTDISNIITTLPAALKQSLVQEILETHGAWS